MNPILRDFPEEFETERLTIRAPRAGDGLRVYEAVRDSIQELRQWMPWAQSLPTPEEEEVLVREERCKFLRRENLMLLLFLKGSMTCVGGTGLHRIDWDVPKFEIGYWVRTPYRKRGLMTEAVAEITRFAFDVLGAERVEIRMDDRNVRSSRIPERLGYTLEGILRNEARDVEGNLRDTRIYARVKRDDTNPIRRSGRAE